jgi:phosphoenolpyruvate-protein kinase (PTS system EI component)
LQQESEDRKNELIVNNLEKEVKDLENLLEEKNSKIKVVEADLAEAHLRNENQIIQVKLTFKDDVSRYEHEDEELKQKVEAEVEKSFKLSEAFRVRGDTCFGFAARSSSRLREIFNSVGAVSEDANHSVNNFRRHFNLLRKRSMILMKLWWGTATFVL